jgi:hypothetical protein
MVVVAADRFDRAGHGVYRAGELYGACAFYLFSFLSPCKKIISPRKRYWSSPLGF